MPELSQGDGGGGKMEGGESGLGGWDRERQKSELMVMVKERTRD